MGGRKKGGKEGIRPASFLLANRRSRSPKARQANRSKGEGQRGAGLKPKGVREEREEVSSALREQKSFKLATSRSGFVGACPLAPLCHEKRCRPSSCVLPKSVHCRRYAHAHPSLSACIFALSLDFDASSFAAVPPLLLCLLQRVDVWQRYKHVL